MVRQVHARQHDSAAVAAQLRAIAPADFRSVLPSIQAPTLVLHSRDFIAYNSEQAQHLASTIPNAQLIEVPGADSGLILGAAGDQVVDAVEEFLTGSMRTRETQRVLATVAFTDLVDSTGHALRTGDRGWSQVLERHDRLIREEAARQGGTVWKFTGDGALVTFDTPGKAIRYLLKFDETIASLGVAMRAGVHAGEIELRGSDIAGVAVHIAARVLGHAGPREVMISRTVADLIAGSGIEFEDRGEHELKGVPGQWRLFAVKS